MDFQSIALPTELPNQNRERKGNAQIRNTFVLEA